MNLPRAVGLQRIIALDVMRGYFILIIASVHLSYYPSLFGLFDGRGQLWTSEAEGFFFISGLLIGIIRQKDMVRHGLRVATEKLFRRGGRLYAASVVLSIFYLIWGRAAAGLGIAGAKGGLDTTSSWPQLLINLLSGRYSYGWSDFLMYYAAFMFIAPVILWLLSKRKWWLVILLTATVWTLRWSGDHGALNPFMQWQIYFFLGTVIGYYWQPLQLRFNQFSLAARRRVSLASIVAALTVFILGAIFVFVPEYFQSQRLPSGQWGQVIGWIVNASHNFVYNQLLVDGRLGLLRPLILLVTAGGMYAFVRRYEDAVVHSVGWLLLPFGRNSLYVYIVEGFFLFAVSFLVGSGSFVANSLLELIIIAAAWLAVHYRVLFRLIPR